MKTLSRCLIVILLCSLSIPFSSPVFADDTQLSSSGGGKEIFSGSIPSGDGIVSIKAISGKLYQVQAMSPLGVIQALAGTDSIESYKIGDELIVKKGIFTLDAINSIENAGEKSWFVVVNDKQLEDYLLPTQEGLNIYPLKNGDMILFVYGNPTRPVSEGERILRVTIGAQAVVQATPVPSQTPEPVQTTPPSVPGSLEPVIPESTLTQPVFEDSEEPGSTPSSGSSSSVKDPNQPVFEDSEEPESTLSSGSSSSVKDPNQPVYEGSEEPESTPSGTSFSARDPNQPVYEGSEEPESTPSGTSSSVKDPNQPVFEDSVEPESSPSPVPTSDADNTSTDITHTTSSSSNRPSGQEVLYDGTISLPSGNVNVTGDSGMEYDVGGNTPIGLLQILATDGKIPSVIFEDQGMRKGNIITIGSIAGYQWGEEAWFVQINGATLQDYITSADGLNIRTFGTGDTITYYYAKLDQSPESAKAAIYLKIE